MSAAVVVLLDSGASAAALVAQVLAEAVLPVLALRVLAGVPLLAQRQAVVGLAQLPPEPLLLHLLPLPLPRVVVESGVPLHLTGRQSFSAAMAKSSRLTGKPMYERAASTG